MPRVHLVKKARKADKTAGIQVGDSYYWWKFRYGGLRKSKTPPRRSQLTQSEFLSTMYEAEDTLSDLLSRPIDRETPPLEKSDYISALEEAVETVRDQGDQCADKAGNLESVFTGGSPTIDLLNSRAEKCEEIVSELESIASDLEDLPEPDDDTAICTCGCERVEHAADGEDKHAGACSCGDCEAYEYDSTELEDKVSEITSVDWSVE